MTWTNSPILAGVMVAVAIAGGVSLDVIGGPPGKPSSRTATVGTATSGSWYCAVGNSAGAGRLELVATLPGEAATSAAVRLDTVHDGRLRRTGEMELLPGTVRSRRAPDGPAQLGVAGRWWRAPVVVSRIWRPDPVTGSSGLVTGACQPHSSPTWYLPGATTAGAGQAWLVLANPFATDAAVNIRLLTPRGLETRERLENVSVPRRSVKTIPLADHIPEQPDLGAIVTVDTGRIVAEAWQSLNPAIGAIRGTSLAELAPAPDDRWTVPWFAPPNAWLWATNVSEQPATLSVTVHTSEGALALPELREVTVAAHSVRRIDLGAVLPDGVVSGAATVVSTSGVPVVVSAASRIENTQVDRTGFALQLGRTDPDRRWILAGGPTRGRQEILHLVNPGDETRTVQVALTTPQGPLAPPPARKLRVAPGAATALNITELAGDVPVHGVVVTSDPPGVVAGIHARSASGQLDLTAHPGTPSRVWATGEVVPAVRYAPALLNQIDTGPPSSPTPAGRLGGVPERTTTPAGGN